MHLQNVDPADSDCPHLVYRDVLGATAVEGLLAHVTARRPAFKSSAVRNLELGRPYVDFSQRSSTSIHDLGPFAAPFLAYVRSIMPEAIARLRIAEETLEPKGLELNVFGDGGHFGAHVDTILDLAKLRVLTCVYYFSLTPRRFSGGELRLFGLPTLSAARRGETPSFVDIAPDPDSMVVFPSWLRHEVLPIHVPSGEWIDGRFTINCWLHRKTETNAY